VGKATRHPQLASILLAQVDGNVLPEGRTANADIDRNVSHMAAENTDELALHSRMLQVEASEHAVGGTREIVLNERTQNALRRVPIRLEGFEKKAAVIAEYFGLDDQHLRDRSPNDIHAGPAHGGEFMHFASSLV
jgi:hypothetical protein